MALAPQNEALTPFFARPNWTSGAVEGMMVPLPGFITVTGTHLRAHKTNHLI